MESIKKSQQFNIQQISSESMIVFVSETVNEQVIKIPEITFAFQQVKRKLISRNELLRVELLLILNVFENAHNIVNEYLSLINIMHEDYLLYASLQKPIILKLHTVISLANINSKRIKHLSDEHSSNLKYSYNLIKEMIKDINQINESFEEISNYSKIWIDNIGGMIKP